MSMYYRDDKTDFKKRLSICVVLSTIAFTIILSRLWYLQLLQGEKFKDLSENNRIRLRRIPAPRGIIFDRKGRVFVDNHPSFNLSITPEDIKDLDKTIMRLATILNTPEKPLKEKLIKSARIPPFKPKKLISNLNRKDIAIIETNKLDLPGITIDVEPMRFYLYEELASHIIGYMGKISKNQIKSKAYSKHNPLDLIGKYGIEYEYETTLRGKDGGSQVEVDAAGRELRVLKTVEPLPGENITLTIDLDIQKIVETSFIGRRGCGIVMDPNNGEILAMASIPSFNPNMFSRGISLKEWRKLINNPHHPLENKAIQGQYPPGSIFKIITAIAGLEEGIITPQTELSCSGSYRLGRRNNRCWKKGGHGTINLHRAIVESCDIYFYQVGQGVGIDRLAYYSNIFGLGKTTGISLSNEKHGLIPTRQWKLRAIKSRWQKGETLSAAIGQGFVLVTPIQMACLISSLANGRVLYRPQLVKRIENKDDNIIKEFFPEKLCIIPSDSIKTTKIIRDALFGVVNEPHGTGVMARIKGVDVSGKTGTAQVVALKDDDTEIEKNAVPFKLRDHAWFVAFAPSNNPKIAVVVLVEHGGHGGSSAAPIAKQIIAESLKVLK